MVLVHCWFRICLGTQRKKNNGIVDIISDVNLAYSEHARRYLADCGLPKERTYVTGSPMAEVLHDNLEKIEASDIHDRLGLLLFRSQDLYGTVCPSRKYLKPKKVRACRRSSIMPAEPDIF